MRAGFFLKRKRKFFCEAVAGLIHSFSFSFVQFPLEKSSRKVYNYSTTPLELSEWLVIIADCGLYNVFVEEIRKFFNRSMKKNNFEQLVCEAIRALPERARAVMENVAFVVEGEARLRKTNEMGIRVDETLLGFYEGVPKTKRGAGYFGVLPDKITIFQKPIEEEAERNEDKLKKLIYEVVWHEVGHHLGFDEKEIRALEAKKRKNIRQTIK